MTDSWGGAWGTSWGTSWTEVDVRLITDTGILQKPVDYQIAGQPKLTHLRNEVEGESMMRQRAGGVKPGGRLDPGRTGFTVTTSRRGYD